MPGDWNVGDPQSLSDNARGMFSQLMRRLEEGPVPLADIATLAEHHGLAERSGRRLVYAMRTYGIVVQIRDELRLTDLGRHWNNHPFEVTG